VVNSGKLRIDIAAAEFYRFNGVRLGQRIERSRRFRWNVIGRPDNKG
jgi:hypothetical protein